MPLKNVLNAKNKNAKNDNLGGKLDILLQRCPLPLRMPFGQCFC